MLIARSVSQRSGTCNGIINFKNKSLAFKNRHLNVTHSISDIKISCKDVLVNHTCKEVLYLRWNERH